MRLDRNHIPWLIFVAIATFVAGLFFLAEFYPQHLPFSFELPRFLSHAPRERNSYGATPLGLSYGVLSLAIFLFAAALGVRKKKRLWRIGNVQVWLRMHIWLTILTIPLVGFHSGFHLGGPQTTTLMMLYAIVMGSGIFGILLQNYLPRVMKELLAREVVYEQIPHIRSRIADSARSLRGTLVEIMGPPKPKSGLGSTVMTEANASICTLLEFLDEECLAYLEASRFRATRMRLGDKKSSDDIFRILRLNVTEDYHGKVDEIQSWCDDRRLMDLQTKLHHWLHGWLLLHVPISFALIVFTFWHAYITWVHL